MKCDKSSEITAYLQGEGTPDERETLRQHFQGCAPCSQELEPLKRTIGALGGLERIEPSPGFQQRVEAAFRSAHPELGRRPATARWRLVRAAGLAAGLLLVMAGVLVFVKLQGDRGGHEKMGHLAPERPADVGSPGGATSHTDVSPKGAAGSWDQATGYDRELLDRVRAGSGGESREIDAAVRWLVQKQEPEGSWKGTDAGETIELTGLAVLVLGGSPEAALASRKGVAFLESRLRDSGAVGGGSPESHAIATLALQEAAIRTREPSVIRAASKAVKLIAVRNQDGPWGRGAVAGWDYHVLRLAIASGDRILIATLIRAREAFGGVQANPAAGGVDLAAALRAELWTEPAPNLAWWTSRVSRVLDDPSLPGTEPAHFQKNDLRFAYFGTALLAPLGGDAWSKWWTPLQAKLTKLQAQDGSWPEGLDPGHGQIYATALSALILETPRRVPKLPD